jgi:hypothetical protein
MTKTFDGTVVSLNRLQFERYKLAEKRQSAIQRAASSYGEFRDRLLPSDCAIHEKMVFLLRHFAVLPRKLPLYCKNRLRFMKRELAERHLRRGRHFADLTQVTTSIGHTAKLDPISRQVKVSGFSISHGLNFETVS